MEFGAVHTPNSFSNNSELFLHLDLNGLAALLKAVETALQKGHGELLTKRAGGRGAAMMSGSSHAFDKLVVSFTLPADRAKTP